MNVQQTENTAPKFYTVAEVSEILRVSQNTVLKLARDGQMAYTKVGKQYRFPADRVHGFQSLEPVNQPPLQTVKITDPQSGGRLSKAGRKF